MWVTGNWRNINGKYNEQSPGMYPQRIWVVCYAAGATMSDGSCDKLRFSFTRRVLYLSLILASCHQKGSIDQAQSLTQFSFLLLLHNCKSQPIVSWKCEKQQNLGWLSATGLLAKPLTDKTETKKNVMNYRG